MPRASPTEDLSGEARTVDRSDPGCATVEPGPWAKLVELVRANPGLDAHDLAAAGWTYEEHGSLAHARRAGVIVWHLGWYAAGDEPETEIRETQSGADAGQ